MIGSKSIFYLPIRPSRGFFKMSFVFLGTYGDTEIYRNDNGEILELTKEQKDQGLKIEDI